MYRCIALAALRAGANLDDGARLGELARRVEIVPSGDRVTLDGENVTAAIRGPEASAAASRVSVHPEVREAMVERQRSLIAAGDYVAEGRDIGTVVSPEAPLKVFLTADDGVRARRRARETGEPPERVLAAQASRDARDRAREHGALRPADDAVRIDTTEMSVDEVTERVVALARERGLAG
jgi:cytidylate kinase